jgi:dTDP-4-dehydrorhamnose 3,5-epimerase
MVPVGVEVRVLDPHQDHRGRLVEIHRSEWGLGIEPVQWNAVSSRANVLRGVHVHLQHTDYITVATGHMALGLCDLRPGSPTEGQSALLDLTEAEPLGVVIPVGVAHGFYFPEPSLVVYSVSHTWQTTDELGCRWDDPGLGIEWPCTAPVLSERDATAGSLSALRAAVARAGLTGPTAGRGDPRPSPTATTR